MAHPYAVARDYAGHPVFFVKKLDRPDQPGDDGWENKKGAREIWRFFYSYPSSPWPGLVSSGSVRTPSIF
jgi:hypothetical protein